ncbi:MAG: hypothetical protein HY906_09485 [Deltaproteobacteria bacterium]|nr:hypothetical protein [Deltaproteobacteria bacterium]
MLKQWSKMIRTADGQEQAERAYWTISIGTVSAAKLIVRLGSCSGRLEFAGDPQALHLLEQESDDAAERVLDSFRTMFPEFAAMRGVQLPSERPYLHVVRSRTDFRWCPETVAGDEPFPLDPRVLEGVPQQVEPLVMRITMTFAKRRASVAHDPGLAQMEAISQTIAAMALGKLVLALHGNGKQAAALEHLAEVDSEYQYAQLRPRAE